MPKDSERMSYLLQKANTLPLRPGVYIMKNASGNIIYVGKSRKLKNRVSQYFHLNEKNAKTAAMVASVHDFDYYVCDTEIEALTLENTLIKQYTPKYNIKLKDAKNYPYIKITDEEFPRLVMTRKRLKDKAKYYGPYSGTSTVFSVIGTVSQTLLLPTCRRRFPKDIGRDRPCLNYQMKRCCGVCTGKVTHEEYDEKIRLAADILKGNTADAISALEEKMFAFSECEMYEAAAKCRDTITALERLSQKQKVVAARGVEHDIIALYSDEVCSAISVFYIRDGAVSDKSEYVFGADRIVDETNISAFICEHYNVREYVPRSVLLSFALPQEERELLEQYLCGIAERKITVHTPERGTNRTLCEMVRDNAAERAKNYKNESEQDEKVLVKLASLLSLETYPERIEAYDISNFGADNLTAGMIVAKNAKLSRADYRSFNIKSVTGVPDDYMSMREALSRRLSHLSDENGSFSELPDLILLDGGRGHVSTIRQLLSEMELDIPVFGMVKDDFHKTRALCTEFEEISIARENSVFVFIYKLQEEVHRFTISRMKNAKTRTLTTSTLTRINGIGPAKAKKLLAHLGGLARVKTASVEELSAVSGISHTDAENIYKYYHGEEEK